MRDQTVDDGSFDAIVSSWRETAQDEELSPKIRSSLFSQVRGVGSPAFGRFRRFVMMGAVPLVAIATLLIVTARYDAPRGTAGKLTVAKVDGQVIFTLVNGKKLHHVFRSTDPRSFDPAAGLAMTANRFEVDAAGGPNLVFYRID